MYSPGLWGGSIVRSTVVLVGDVTVVGDGRDSRYFRAYEKSDPTNYRRGENAYIQPNIVPLLRGCRDFHLPVCRGNDDTVLVQARRHGVGVEDRPHSLNVRALRTRLGHIRGARVRRAPVQSLGVWMHPEETLVAGLTVTLADGLPGVLVQELADHGLSNGVNHCRICWLLRVLWLGRAVGRLARRNGSASRSVWVPL